jgi:hypothetical protein
MAVRSKKYLWVNFNRYSSGESKDPLQLAGKIRTILKIGRSAQRPLPRQRVLLCQRLGLLLIPAPHSTDLTNVFTPPSQLSFSSLIWKISNVSKVLASDLPSVSPMTLGLICIS